LRKGAADYLGRPLDLGRLAYVADILTIRARYASPPPEKPATESIQLGSEQPYLYVPSGPMGLLMQQVRRVAPQETTILLTGETGTGKTCLARLIHEMSPRREKPFLTVNCGSLSVNLIASELFGHIRGAYTGADRDRTGKFSEVGTGTLLLDEIDALPVELQSQLLRVVEERVFEKVGSNRTLRMEARLIVATNRALDQEVAAGRFRSDLYYRLNVVGFHLAPLRERRDLIPALTEHFVALFASRNGRPMRGLTPDSLQTLQSYAWPGNIRELRNVIERAVALCPSELIEAEDLPEVVRQASAAPPATGLVAALMNGMTNGHVNGHANRHLNGAAGETLAKTKEDAEIRRITQALARHKNNRLRAAAELGISRMALYKKLHRYGLMGET
jgi:two-component system response regulator HydG